VSKDESSEIEMAANMNSGNDDITAGATDGMLGPNPFVGLRAIDMLAAARQIGTQAMLHPALLLDQTAALARDLTSAVSGKETSTPERGDKRFADPAWRDQPL
jgi:polyhydroxyalkanoate synthase